MNPKWSSADVLYFSPTITVVPGGPGRWRASYTWNGKQFHDPKVYTSLRGAMTNIEIRAAHRTWYPGIELTQRPEGWFIRFTVSLAQPDLGPFVTREEAKAIAEATAQLMEVEP